MGMFWNLYDEDGNPVWSVGYVGSSYCTAGQVKEGWYRISKTAGVSRTVTDVRLEDFPAWDGI